MRGRTILFLLLATRVAHAAPVLLARIGDPSPFGLPFSRFSDASLDDRGHVAFVGASTAIFTRAGDALVHVAGAGDLLLGHRLAGVGPAVASADCLAFRSAFVGGGAGVFRQCSGTPTLVVESGLPAPGGGRLAGFGDEVAIGSGRQVAFTAALEDGSVGLFLVDAGGVLREVTRSGALSPAGGAFTGFRLVGVSGSGRLAFRGVTSNGPDGLFYWDGLGIQKLAVVGDAIPGAGSFASVGLGRMNDGDAWAFRATLASGSRAGVFRAFTGATPPTVSAVALQGDPTPVGGSFGGFPNSLVPAINANGAIAFRAAVTDSPFPSGVFVAPGDGSVTKVVAVGEATAVGGLVRLREVAIADDGGVLVRATLLSGTPGLFQARAGRVDRFAVLGDATDLGAGFRFTDPAAQATAATALFLGAREGLFVAAAPGAVTPVATLGDPTPLRGLYAGFDPPAAGGRLTVFGASIQDGRSGEALLAVSALSPRGPAALVRSGDSVRGVGPLRDLFANPLDDLARPAVGGAVAFQAAVGVGTGILVRSGGRLRAVARSGKAAPGKGTYVEFGSPGLGRGGDVAFVALVREHGQALIHVHGGRSQLVAARGDETGTRLGGTFRAFDTPAVSGPMVAFRALLEQPPEAVFAVIGGCTMALAGGGETAPGGGRFKSFGPPAFAGGTLVFRASVLGGSAPVGIYRATPSRRCTDGPPAIEPVAVAGTPSPAGPPFLGFGAPAGNRRGAVVFTADLTGGGASDAVVLVSD